MKAIRAMDEYIEFLWAVGCMVLGFHIAFSIPELAMGSLHPEITRALCGSFLGFWFGGVAAIAGYPLVHLISKVIQILPRKRIYEWTDTPNSANSRRARQDLGFKSL